MTKWVLVPGTATEEMIDAGHNRLADEGTLADLYAAMLSARPPVPESVITDLVNKWTEIQSATVPCPRCAGQRWRRRRIGLSNGRKTGPHRSRARSAGPWRAPELDQVEHEAFQRGYAVAMAKLGNP